MLGIKFFPALKKDLVEFKRPPQTFHFQEPLDPPLANHLRIFPLFKGEEPEELARELGKPELLPVLKKHYALESFQAKTGEILRLPEHSLVLGGLGKLEKWHPEKACELFRLLGEALANLKELSLEFVLRPKLLEALEKHKEKGDSFSDILTLDLKRQAEKKDKKDSSKDKKKEEQALPDYISHLGPDDFICQLVACMNIGAEPMEILKTKASRSSSIEKKILLPSLFFSLVPFL